MSPISDPNDSKVTGRRRTSAASGTSSKVDVFEGPAADATATIDAGDGRKIVVTDPKAI